MLYCDFLCSHIVVHSLNSTAVDVLKVHSGRDQDKGIELIKGCKVVKATINLQLYRQESPSLLPKSLVCHAAPSSLVPVQCH